MAGPSPPSPGWGRLSALPTDFLSSPAPVAEDLYALIASQYEVRVLPVGVGAEPFEILLVRDSNRLLDLISPEMFSSDERLPYWADLWTSSIDLARWLLEECDVAGQTVLELGSGVGLAGIAAARAGAQVTLTDYETDALLFARYNALMNLPADAFRNRIRCVPMDWRAPDTGATFGVIIGADIVYERRNFVPILSLLQSHLLPGGRALLTEPDRAVGQAFLAAAEEYPFSLHHSYSAVVRDGKTYRISRILLHYEPVQTT
ncbi:methyltransferase type 12 [bacterium]|nr:MAG: methyltransferase type 12 [bacterium]